MDTDELSEETYKAIFHTAEKYHHNLTLQFGLLASQCKNDDDYLNKASKLILYHTRPRRLNFQNYIPV